MTIGLDLKAKAEEDKFKGWKERVAGLMAARFHQLGASAIAVGVTDVGELAFTISIGLPYDPDPSIVAGCLAKIPEMRRYDDDFVLHLGNAIEAGPCPVASLPVRLLIQTKKTLILDAVDAGYEVMKDPLFIKKFEGVTGEERTRAARIMFVEECERRFLVMLEGIRAKPGCRTEDVRRAEKRLSFILEAYWQAVEYDDYD